MLGFSVSAWGLFTHIRVYAIERLKDRFIVWPDEERKAEISRWFRKNKRFPNMIGAVDGVLIPFDIAPQLETKTWNTRKCRYAMGVTAVCDHLGRFTFISTSYAGSMHDSVAYRNTSLYKEKEEYFKGKEYLLGDAGYALIPTVIARYRQAAGGSENAKFNSLHGKTRVKIELS